MNGRSRGHRVARRGDRRDRASSSSSSAASPFEPSTTKPVSGVASQRASAARSRAASTRSSLVERRRNRREDAGELHRVDCTRSRSLDHAGRSRSMTDLARLQHEIQPEHDEEHRRRRAEQPREIGERPDVRRVVQHRAPARDRLGKAEADVRQRRLGDDERRHQHASSATAMKPRAAGSRCRHEQPHVARAERRARPTA